MTDACIDSQIDPEELREAAQRLLTDKVERRAPWEGRGDEGATLAAEMKELGWFQLVAPEAQGGLGQPFEVLAPIYEEMGRALAPVWLAGTMATIDALTSVGTTEADAIVATIISEGWRVTPLLLRADQSLLSAKWAMVPGAVDATHFLIVSEAANEAVLMSSAASGVSIEKVETWDIGRTFGAVTLDKATQKPAGFDVQALASVLRAHGELALALDSIGGAAQCLAETVDYMLGREQFGRPIASFQALKHRAADHKVAVELARALVLQAVAAFSMRNDGWDLLAAQARVLACETYAGLAEDSIQLFGGVGFTWEYDPHLFLKRALANQIIGDSVDETRDRIAGEICRRAIRTRP